jgi:hypothetical protein
VINLVPGAYDLGIRLDNLHNNALEFNDFKRVKLIYERPDLSGTWEGVWHVDEAVNAIQYIEDVLTRIVVWTGLVKDEAKARAAIREGIDDSGTYVDRAMAIELEALDPTKGDRYRARVLMEGDPGEIAEYSTEATFREGVFSFKVRAEGTVMTFTGQLAGDGALEGSFSADAWGVVKDALSGRWEVQRQGP